MRLIFSPFFSGAMIRPRVHDSSAPLPHVCLELFTSTFLAAVARPQQHPKWRQQQQQQDEEYLLSEDEEGEVKHRKALAKASAEGLLHVIQSHRQISSTMADSDIMVSKQISK